MSALKPVAALAGGRGSLRLRLLVGTLVWIVLAIAVTGWGLGALFSRHVAQQFHVELRTHLDQLAANLVFDADGQAVLTAPLSDPRFARPYSGLYWQVDRIDGAVPAIGVLRARSLWDVALAVPADALADGEQHAHRVDGPDGAPLRMIEQVLRPAEQPQAALRLIVAADEGLIGEPVARFTRLLVLGLGLLGAGLVAAALVQVRIGLRPLARLREGLAAVHEGRRRAIEGAFPSEIQPLVDEFNAVLVRNAEIVERARTQAGNLAHALKTPLTVLANAAAQPEGGQPGEPAGGGEGGALARLVAEQVGLARTQIDYHLARARAAAAAGIPGQRTPLRPALDGLLRLMAKVHAGRGLEIGPAGGADALVFRGEAQDLQEMLGNLLDNACKWAAHRVRVEARAVEGGRLEVAIDDDGPGLPPAVREAVFGRGVRADENTPGSGLGLAIVRDLARLYGGDIALETSALGGLRAVLTLPAA